MKKLLLYSACGLLIAQAMLIRAESVIEGFGKAGKKLLAPVEASQKMFPTSVDDKKEKLEELLKLKAQLEAESKKFFDKYHANSEEIKAQLDISIEALKNNPEDEFLTKKIALENERYQTIKSMQQSREQLVELVKEHIALLQDYIKDPNFKEYKKDLVPQRDTYSLEELQNLTQILVDKEKSITLLNEQEKNIDVEIESRKRTALAAAESCKKKNEPEVASGSENYGATFDLTSEQKIELAQLQERLALEKNENESLRLQELEQKKALTKTRIFIAKLQLSALKELLSRVKPAIKVSEADVAFARDELVKKQQQLIAVTEQHNQTIESLSREIKSKEKERQEAMSRYGIALDTELDDWSKQPKDTVAGYLGFLEVANLNDSVALLQREKDFIAAQVVLDDVTMRNESMVIDVKDSFYKINAQKFASEEEARQERKKYELAKADVRAQLSHLKDIKNTDQDRLDHKKKALQNVKDLRQKIVYKKNTLFKNRPEEFGNCLELLNSAEHKIQHQIELLTKTQNIYTDAITVLGTGAKNIDFIIAELELTTIWQRSKYAITWEGFQNIIPDLELFITDIRTYVITIRNSALITAIAKSLKTPWSIMIVVIKILLLIAGILFVQRLFPILSQSLVRFGTSYKSLRGITLLVAAIVGFIGKYAASIIVWLAILAMVFLYEQVNPYPYILVYLLSIPYLLYLANRFIAYIEEFNSKHNYVFIAKDFQRRFKLVMSTLLYATISIVLFREAFLLAGYPKSELPTILLAGNFIILQIALIFLIAKEQILTIIPATNEMWRWIAVQVDRFYYLILMFVIAIIVMSNPYVGFGKLVWYILKRIILTILVIRLLLWCNMVLRRGLSYVFFSRGEEFVRERFAYGKTLYGFFAVTIFLFFIIIGCIIGAKIWGWPEAFAKISQWSDIMGWLQTPILLEKSDNPISVFTILKLLFFIIVGFFAAFVVDSFVLEKIFDVLLVDSGVQNTISSIIRYIILMMTLILGFQSVGLGELVLPLVGALVLGIGWVIKDPISDFIAYFIILVQRPVKIGDYIKMDEDTHGVVRKITPRSVIVRRKNSTTIVLPNSMVINKPLVNWNYVRGFVAFEDIEITVSYREDPAKVKALLLKVMDENPFVLKNPNPIVRLDNFGESGFVFMARGFLSSNYTLDAWDIASDVRLAMVVELRKHGIQLAVPARIIINKDSVASQLAEAGKESSLDEKIRG